MCSVQQRRSPSVPVRVRLDGNDGRPATASYLLDGDWLAWQLLRMSCQEIAFAGGASVSVVAAGKSPHIL